MSYCTAPKTAKVSVIMSAYNSAAYIAEAIDSILAQSCADFVLYVVDDKSTDATKSIVEEYARHDKRLCVLANAENMGIAASHNKALRLCTTPYIAPMGADDIVLPDWLQKKYDFLEQHPELAALGNAQQAMSHDGATLGAVWAPSPLSHKITQALFASGTGIPHGSSLLRTEVVRALGGYRENFVAALDVDFWLRLAERYHIGCLPDILQYYRQHPHSISRTRATTQACNHVLALIASEKRRQHLPDPLTGKKLDLELLHSLLEGGSQSALLWFNLLSLRDIEHKEKYIPKACMLAYQRPCSPSFLRQQLPTWHYFTTHFPQCTEEILAIAAVPSLPSRDSDGQWQENVRRVSQGAAQLQAYATTLPASDAPAAVALALSEYSRVLVRQLLYANKD